MRNILRVSLAVAFIAMFVLTGCFKRQQATNTNTTGVNTNTNASATSTATENGGSAKNDAAQQDGGQKEDKPANTNANVSNNNTAEGSPAPPPEPPSLTLALGAQNNVQQTGSAVIRDIGEGKSHVTIRITGAPLNTPQPANIHAGMCAAMGPVRHALNNAVNGSSDTVLLIPYETLISQAPFSVGVRKSNLEYSLLVVCGDKL